MKTNKIFIVIVLIIGLVTSCDYNHIRASGSVTTVEYDFTDYSGLQVSNAFNVYLSFSDTQESIEIDVNENIKDRIIVRKEGDDLVIKLKKRTNILGRATLNAYITTNTITDFDISGASSINLENILEATNAKIELSGASDFLGEVETQNLTLDMSGASNANLFGTTDVLGANLSGSSTITDYDLMVGKLNMEMSGASEGFLSISETLTIEASGASTLNYKGNPVIERQELSGASEIKKRD